MTKSKAEKIVREIGEMLDVAARLSGGTESALYINTKEELISLLTDEEEEEELEMPPMTNETNEELKHPKRELKLQTVYFDNTNHEVTSGFGHDGRCAESCGHYPSKNADLLVDFTKYCEAHPGERFYQALKNWSGAYKILYQYPDTVIEEMIDEDTYEWETKDGK